MHSRSNSKKLKAGLIISFYFLRGHSRSQSMLVLYDTGQEIDANRL